MSTETTNTDPGAAPNNAPAATTFQLKATNDSSLSGSRYFNVFPPILTNIAANSQILTALVSAPTSEAEPTAMMTWKGGSSALALFAFPADASPDAAPRTPVALADTVVVDWANGAFTLTPAPGGPANGIEVTFTTAVPVETQIGLVVGPGAILLQLPVGPSPLTLMPDLSATATVVFGTAFQWPVSPFLMSAGRRSSSSSPGPQIRARRPAPRSWLAWIISS